LLCVFTICENCDAAATNAHDDDDDDDVTDRKFAVKARLYQALGVTLAVVRSYLHSAKVLQPLISVLKLYATDG